MEVVITKCTTTGFTIGSRHCFITLLFQQLLNKLFLPFEMVKQKNITMFFFDFLVREYLLFINSFQ